MTESAQQPKMRRVCLLPGEVTLVPHFDERSVWAPARVLSMDIEVDGQAVQVLQGVAAQVVWNLALYQYGPRTMSK